MSSSYVILVFISKLMVVRLLQTQQVTAVLSPDEMFMWLMPLNLRLQGAAFLPSSPWAVESLCSGKLNQEYLCNVTHFLCESSHPLLTLHL